MKYFIKTFGCQMNISDSERLAAFLEERNFSLTEKINEADLAIFNTCGIKQTAENRAYSMINNLRKEKQGAVKIVMTGCLAHRADVQKRMKTKVDLFCEIKNFPETVTGIFQSAQTSEAMIPNKEQIDYLSINPKHTNSFTAYVPIMTGCNNFCTYCVVPYARGREVSRSAQEIIAETKELIAKGYKNIILLGQNVNSYCDKSRVISQQSSVTFPVLLKKINAIPGKFWIQFVSSHPKDMSDELIEAATKLKKVCEWIHLPVQAGDDEILRKMNRKYTQKHYLGRIRKIKASFKKNKPDALFSISSDIIVGFPSETKKQFLESAAVMKKVKFDMVFFGQFSPRPGTVAWKMKDDVSQEEKFRRENFLNEILKQTSFANNKKYLNKTVEVLVEKEKDGFYFGKTRTQKNVKITSSPPRLAETTARRREAGKKNPIGTIIKVTITKANAWNLEGTLK
jgi:tRNA-2-methylthio-N6-dimethylallyladenosine synthase